MLTRARVSQLAAEFLGTGLIVMMALVLSETTAVSYFIATSVAVALGVAYMVFGPVSGGHFNPAITVGLWAVRRIQTLVGASYVAAQMLGGVAAWQAYQYFSDHTLGAKSGAFDTRVWLAEAIGAFILALGFTAAVSRSLTALESALTYGASFFVGIMVAATASAAYINPAIALGLRGFNAAYVLGPLVGGVLGVSLYYLLFAPAKVAIRLPRLRR
jgi:glycerol uptake facilitator-like aquaporin